MNPFIFCTFTCKCHSLLLHLIVNTFILLGFSFEVLDVTSYILIIPVVTRSQAKASIGSNDGLSMLLTNKNSIDSNNGLLLFSSHVISSNDELSHLPHTTSTNNDYSSGLVSSSLFDYSSSEFRHSTVGVTSLKISNSSPFGKFGMCVVGSDYLS
jgi:hypothetical protein